MLTATSAVLTVVATTVTAAVLTTVILTIIPITVTTATTSPSLSIVDAAMQLLLSLSSFSCWCAKGRNCS